MYFQGVLKCIFNVCGVVIAYRPPLSGVEAGIKYNELREHKCGCIDTYILYCWLRMKASGLLRDDQSHVEGVALIARINGKSTRHSTVMLFDACKSMWLLSIFFCVLVYPCTLA